MEFRRLIGLIRNRLWLIVAIVVAAILGAYLATPRSAGYRSTAVVYVGPSSANTPISATQQEGNALLATSFAKLVKSPSVAAGAIAAARVPRSVASVVRELSGTAVPSTSLIDVTVTDPDAAYAQRLADTAATAFVQVVTKLAGGGGSKTTKAKAPVVLLQPAGLAGSPLPTELRHNLILAGLFGILGALALVLLIDYLDLSSRSPEAVERRIGLPVLGIVPLQPDLSGSLVVAPTAPPPAGAPHG